MFEEYLLNEAIEELVDPHVLIIEKSEAVINVLYKMLQDDFLEGVVPFVEKDYKTKQYAILRLQDLSISKDDLFDFDQKIEDMLPNPLNALQVSSNISTIMEAFENLETETIPIEKHGKLFGVIRKNDLLNHYLPQFYEISNSYKEFINHMHEAISVIDQNGLVKVWNNQAEILYEIPREKIINQKLVDFLPNALGIKILDTRESVDNVHYSPKEGYIVSNSSKPIFLENKFIGVLSAEMDLSQEKVLVNKLQIANSKLLSLPQEGSNINKAFPDYIREQQTSVSFEIHGSQNLEMQMERYEKAIIEKALETNNYNKSKTAKYLEVPRSTLYYKLEKHKLE